MAPLLNKKHVQWRRHRHQTRRPAGTPHPRRRQTGSRGQSSRENFGRQSPRPTCAFLWQKRSPSGALDGFS